MDSSAARPVRLGCFDARNGLIVVADQSLPIAVEVDGASGRVAGVFTWPVLPGLRSRRTALDVLVLEESIMIASPAAGGVVQVSRRSGQVTLIALEADAGALTACGDAVWAVAGPDWYRPGPGVQLAEGQERQRPVVWEEPTAAEVAREEEASRLARLAGRSRPAAEDAWSMADLRRADGDYVIRGPATPVWCIRGGTARRIDADLEAPRLAAVAGTIVGACQLPDDPVIKHVGPGGLSISYGYPGTIVVLDDAGKVQALGPVASTRGVICEDRGRVWLLGFDSETSDLEGSGLRELLLAEGRITGGPDARLHNPVGVMDGLVVDLGWQPPPPGLAGRTAARSVAVRFLPVDGGDPSAVPVPVPVPGPWPDAEAKVQDGQVWVGRPGDAALMVVTPGNPSARELRVALDLRPWISRPQLPPGLDARQFEQSQLDRFRKDYLGGWQGEDGEIRPLIEGVSFEAIELRGAFPGSEVVALFRSSGRPRIQFGRRRSLYDELGNPISHQFAGIYLMEDFDTAGPPLDQCVPDASGVVWV